ncbi:MAG: hypothetical protein CMI52_03260 [Parcubacteria group bacterium]|nr:hypothetical protein [Parcubacteria group bacterium]
MAMWVLRIAVAGEFIGHGVFALQGKEQWVGWIQQMLSVDLAQATQLLTYIGYMDILVALIVLLKPIRAVVLWAALWGLWTALIRPLTGGDWWDFVERWANWGAPLALLYLMGMPSKLNEWWKS